MAQYEYRKFFIGGEWVDPAEPRELAVINPATEEPAGVISLGGSADVDRAVAAARKAFAAYSQTGKQERLELIDAFIAAYKARYNDMADAITAEMGAPKRLSTKAQAAMGVVIAKTARRLLENFEFEEQRGGTLIRREPIGVCGFITPWNWPVNQITLKVLPALAAGCAMVLKPSEIAPFSGVVFAEVIEAAGVPTGVFNLVNGDGPGVGQAIAGHPDIDMVSFTGSTRGGYRGGRHRRRNGQAGQPGTGRQVAQPHPGRSLAGTGRNQRHAQRLHEHGPVVQRAYPPARPRPNSTTRPWKSPWPPPRGRESAIPLPKRPPWGRWSAKPSSTRCRDLSRRA